MRERVIEAYLRKRVRQAGGQCLKWVSPGCRGVPDRIVLLPRGRCIFVELKSETGKLSTSQKRMLRTIEKLDHDTAVLRSKEDVDDFLDELPDLYDLHPSVSLGDFNDGELESD